MTNHYAGELDCALRAAAEAGGLLRRAFHVGERDVDRRAEVEIHRTLAAEFPDYGYRGEELGCAHAPQDRAGHLWLVDPDDGTSAFEQGYRGSAVSIALLREGRPVLGVVYAHCAPDDDGDLFAWAEGAGPIRRNGRDVAAAQDGVPETVLVSHRADGNPQANAAAVAPMRFRAIPSIAYRLALVAAGEARAAVSLNGPVGWDYAGGQAIPLGAGMDLFDAAGGRIRYDRNGNSNSSGQCFGGPASVIEGIRGRDWAAVFQRPSEEPEPYPLCSPKRGSAVADAGLLSRAQGCLLGQLAGDALGGLVEFGTAAAIRREHPAGVRVLVDGGGWGTLAGQPTDDSEMALALARSVLDAGGYDPQAAARAYAWWHESRPYDMGRTTATAVSAAARAIRANRSAAESSRAAALQDGQANGALMRVSPLGVLGAGSAEGSAGRWAQQDASLTHPHPVCQNANRVYAETVAFAIRTGAGRKRSTVSPSRSRSGKVRRRA